MFRLLTLFAAPLVLTGSLHGDVFTFWTKPTQTAVSFSLTSEIFANVTVTITGKKDGVAANVGILNGGGGGLGVVGGASDYRTEPGEQLIFEFTSGPVLTAQYNVYNAGPSTLTLGDRTVELFDAGGASLGAFAQDGTGTFDIFNLVGPTVPVSKFTLLATDALQPNNGFSVAIINGNFITVPEPSSLAILIPLATSSLLIARSRRPRKASI